MERISNDCLYFIFTNDKKMNYEDTRVGIDDLASFLERPKDSVKKSIKRLDNKDFILKDKNNIKHIIICELEMRSNSERSKENKKDKKTIRQWL